MNASFYLFRNLDWFHGSFDIHDYILWVLCLLHFSISSSTVNPTIDRVFPTEGLR